jgi:predicted helicase
LYFYEDFLASYDEKLRKNRGVYYTPAQVVQAQVTLVAQLLEERFSKHLSFVDDNIVTLDPAVGTGTYLLAALQFGLEQVAARYGEGAMGNRAASAARNFYAFEILVGPYSVAHLRLTQQILEAKGSLPGDGVHVYLTDTLESPYAMPAGQLRLDLLHRRLTEESRRAREVKAKTRVLVCIGNPPYYRQTIGPDDIGVERQGGWVRYGDHGDDGIFEDFLQPVRDLGLGKHSKNLYNLYVYFWRWALWKVLDSTEGPGIISFITASSYIRGPGFLGMRQVMRQTFDELWIIDLEGGNLGPRKTENVFAIQTPVAIAIGVRYGPPDPQSPAKAHYTRFEGTREEKLDRLALIRKFADIDWQECFSGWGEPFLPVQAGDYFGWPLLTDIFPWQQPGVKAGRTWPIGVDKDTLNRRWSALLSVSGEKRQPLFKNSPTGRKAHLPALPLMGGSGRAPAITELPRRAAPPPIARFAFRSFDRQWIFADSRLLDRHSPPLWAVQGPEQAFMTSLLTGVIGLGPAATVSAYIPDLHHFRGSFGGRDVIPLWRDRAGSEPNIVEGLLALLKETYGSSVKPSDLFAYAYSVLATPTYVERFSEELTFPGPHLPLTKESNLFRTGVELGRRLIWLHTYGERMGGKRHGSDRVPQGKARCTVAVPGDADRYPETFSYDEQARELRVGDGSFRPISSDVWSFSVSGLEVVRSWLAYRVGSGAGRKSSPLDDVRPQQWTSEFTEELLQLLWIIEATIEMRSSLDDNLTDVLRSDLFRADEVPQPSSMERRPPAIGSAGQAELEVLDA